MDYNELRKSDEKEAQEYLRKEIDFELKEVAKKKTSDITGPAGDFRTSHDSHSLSSGARTTRSKNSGANSTLAFEPGRVEAKGIVRRLDSDRTVLIERTLREYEVASWDLTRLRYAINFINATHGNVFAQRDLQAVFESQTWYRPTPGVSMEDIDAKMSHVEAANVKILADMRSRKR